MYLIFRKYNKTPTNFFRRSKDLLPINQFNIIFAFTATDENNETPQNVSCGTSNQEVSSTAHFLAETENNDWFSLTLMAHDSFQTPRDGYSFPVTIEDNENAADYNVFMSEAPPGYSSITADQKAVSKQSSAALSVFSSEGVAESGDDTLIDNDAEPPPYDKVSDTAC